MHTFLDLQLLGQYTFLGLQSFSQYKFLGLQSFSQYTFLGLQSFSQSTFLMLPSFGQSTFLGLPSFGQQAVQFLDNFVDLFVVGREQGLHKVLLTLPPQCRKVRDLLTAGDVQESLEDLPPQSLVKLPVIRRTTVRISQKTMSWKHQRFKNEQNLH